MSEVESVSRNELARLKKRMKGMSKNELIRLALVLGNEVGFLKTQNQSLDKIIKDYGLSPEKEEEVQND